jgi:four helix bundle protein
MAGKVRDFEDLDVFQKARELVSQIYTVTGQGKFSKDFGLVDQMRRAGVSIVSNIAEGFERGGNPELIQFLYIAKGSCGELRSQLMVALDQGYLTKETYHRLVDVARHVSIMLKNLAAYLKKSDYKGPKHV